MPRRALLSQASGAPSGDPPAAANTSWGFNMAQVVMSNPSQIYEDLAVLANVFRDNTTGGTVDSDGYPATGATQLAIYPKDKLEIGVPYTITHTGSGTPASGTTITFAAEDTQRNINFSGDCPNLSIKRAGAGKYTSTFSERANYAHTLRFMQPLNITRLTSEGDNYQDSNPYVRETVGANNTFYNRTLTPALIREICDDHSCNAWICIHHLMGTANIEAFADAFIGFTGTLYVEHSNEVWNSDFTTYQYATTQVGSYTGPGDAQNVQAWHADRTDEIGEVFKTRLSGVDVKVVWASQHANPFYIQNSLQYAQRPLSYIDGTCTAPYIGQAWATTQTLGSLSGLSDQDVADAVLNDFSTNIAPNIDTWKAAADARGWDYYAYEGGPSLYNADSAVRTEMIARLQATEFQDVYTAYLNYWATATNNALFMLYRDIGNDVFGHIAAEKLTGAPRWQTYVNRMNP